MKVCVVFQSWNHFPASNICYYVSSASSSTLQHKCWRIKNRRMNNVLRHLKMKTIFNIYFFRRAQKIYSWQPQPNLSFECKQTLLHHLKQFLIILSSEALTLLNIIAASLSVPWHTHSDCYTKNTQCTYKISRTVFFFQFLWKSNPKLVFK